MFVEAIETAAQFTRPIHSIVRYFGSSDVIPGTSTLFFVNSDGWALTCKHVIQEFAAVDVIEKRYRVFRSERDKIPAGKHRNKLIRDLERKLNLDASVPAEFQWVPFNCVVGAINFVWYIHPTLDLALVHFQGFTKLLCETFPKFPKDTASLQQGRAICRLGFPFPGFTNYSYDPTTDRMQFTNTGRLETPRFPIDGMLTRHLVDQSGEIVGFELSTPGLRGQSGGPAFDRLGRIWGMQSATIHLDLNFDVDAEVVRFGKKRKISASTFLHVGHCVHVDPIKAFMREKAVRFDEV